MVLLLNVFSGSTPFGWTIAKRLIFSKIRKALGFDRCIFSCSGAAPISREALEFFASINIPVFEALGLSESSGTFRRKTQSNGAIEVSIFSKWNKGQRLVATVSLLKKSFS